MDSLRHSDSFTNKTMTRTSLSKISALIAAGTWLATASLHSAEPNSLAAFKAMKHGFFVHYVYGGAYGNLTIDKNGHPPKSLDELAGNFDVEGFANDLAAWHVEYVIFTAWHANINPLFPSQTMKKWGLDSHYCQRDLLGEIIKACKKRGIQVLFYTHPRDGHDLRGEEQIKTGWGINNGQPDPDWAKFDFKKWNDFVNDLYGELVDRYGSQIAGLYLDEGSGAGDSYRVVDYPRLRATIKRHNPNLVMIQNFYGNLYSCDVGDKEYCGWGEFAKADGSAWPAYTMPVGTCFATTWWSGTPSGKNTVRFSAEDMFRYTVLEAGANSEGGGVQWATGPYMGGGWETGVEETMRKVGASIQNIAESIKQTIPSTSYVTPAGKRTADLQWGVATKSLDERTEYLHVLCPPASSTLTLPVPADGKKFSAATLLPGGQKVALSQDAAGVKLTLPVGVAWEKLDTVIKLAVAKDSPPVNVAQWRIFEASSWLDTAHHPHNLIDGSEATAWRSRTDDKQAWAQVDLGQSCRISRIEVAGADGGNLELRVSDTANFSRSELVASQPASGRKLTIVKAGYGAGDKTADVTEKVRAAANGSSLSIVADNRLAGSDPAPNVVKELRVEYSLEGRTQTATVKEGETLQIGETRPWIVELPRPGEWRFVRVSRAPAGEPLSIRELKVFGNFK